MESKPNLILFGAGASYGSDSTGCPPLTLNLVDELIRFNPNGWGSLDSSLLASFRQDFELAMKSLYESGSYNVSTLQRAMAAYFFGFQPRNSNLYFKLAVRMKNSSWNGCIASLNYERLTEICLSAANVDPKKITLCLPHGCCHLFNSAVMGNAANVHFMANSVTTNCDPSQLIVVHDPGEFSKWIQQAMPPIMSYFEPNKRSNSGENLILGHRDHFKTQVLAARHIAIVGVKIRENDNHIWEPLSKTAADSGFSI